MCALWNSKTMGEGPREVAQRATRPAVILLLTAQPDVVADRQEPVEAPAGLVGAPLEGQVVRQPEDAGQEGALVGRQAVDGRFGRGAGDEPVPDQVALDRRDGPEGAGVVPSASSRPGASSAGWRRAASSRTTARTRGARGRSPRGRPPRGPRREAAASDRPGRQAGWVTLRRKRHRTRDTAWKRPQGGWRSTSRPPERPRRPREGVLRRVRPPCTKGHQSGGSVHGARARVGPPLASTCCIMICRFRATRRPAAGVRS